MKLQVSGLLLQITPFILIFNIFLVIFSSFFLNVEYIKTLLESF